MGFRDRGGRGGKKSNFIRVGNMFESDKNKLNEKMEYQFGTTVHGKYLDQVLAVLQDNDAVRFTFTKWDDGEHPVLSVAPAEQNGGARGGRGGFSRSSGPARRSSGPGASRPTTSRGPARERGIEQDREPEETGDPESDETNNWDK